MTRVTNLQVHRLALNSVNDTRGRLMQAQQVALSGKRVVLPSDDPTAAARARMLEGMRSRAESHKANVSYGMARLQTAEQALAEGGNTLSRVKEIALAMANGTYNAEDRANSAQEIEALRRGIVDIMNTKHLGEYVFANINSGNPPYDTTAETFTYDPSFYDAVREVEVGPSRIAEIGASGAHAFAQRSGDPDSVDVPAVVAAIRDALNANDPDAIRAALVDLDAGYSQVVRERAQTGVRMGRLEDAEQAAVQSDSVFSQLHGELVDADAAKSFSELSLAQTTMQAAVSVAAKILGPSLLDVL